ncbi:hypothetical protein LINGRAHAP2_LOCUS6564 [Linum grandiflorum]
MKNDWHTSSTVRPSILSSRSSFFIVLCWFPYSLGSSWLAGGNSCRRHMRLMMTGLTPASISLANSSSVLQADLSSGTIPWRRELEKPLTIIANKFFQQLP